MGRWAGSTKCQTACRCDATSIADMRFAVSRRLRDEFANGRVYHELDGRQIRLPTAADERPNAELLAWHQAEVCQER
jgi:hypothetical protein